jgi:transposase
VVYDIRLEVSPDEMKAAIILINSLLDEQQCRLYAGLESMKLGHGGDRLLAEFFGLDPHTIARGRRQLLGSGCRGRPDATTRGRTQTSGEETPEVIEAFEILLEHDTAGDPITGIRWTHKTPAGIAELLRQPDIEISANTVARLLHDMDFSLRVNFKAIATDSSPDRDQH